MFLIHILVLTSMVTNTWIILDSQIATTGDHPLKYPSQSEQAAWNEQLGLTLLALLTELKAGLLWHPSKSCQDFVCPKISCLVYFFTLSVLSVTFRDMINTNVKNPWSHVLQNPSPLISTGSTHSWLENDSKSNKYPK